MYWAEERIGSSRMQGAYAYKTLLEKAGLVALGTDFPVEQVNPFHTFPMLLLLGRIQSCFLRKDFK